MVKKFLLLLLLTTNYIYSQTDKCHPDCPLKWEDIRNMRNPLWAKVSEAGCEDCIEKVEKKRKEYEDEDYKQFSYLKNVACSYYYGWVENNKGECSAGGPPPCCPAQHWHKDPNAWNYYEEDMKKIYWQRHKELGIIYEACLKSCKDRLEQQRILDKQKAQQFDNLVQDADKLKKDKKYSEAEAKYRQAKGLKPNTDMWIESRITDVQKQRDDDEKQTAQKEAKNEKKEEKKQEKATQQYYYEQTQHDLDRQYAQQRHSQYEQNNTANLTGAIALSAAWLGLYIFPEPINSRYEKKGGFFSFAPLNSIVGIPTFENNTTLTSTEYKYASGNVTENKLDTSSKANTMIYTPNFGLKMEFGWVGDRIHLTFPVKGSIGFFTESRVCFQGSGGMQLFAGARKIKHWKLGFSYEYSFQSGSRLKNIYGTDSYGSVPDPTSQYWYGYTTSAYYSAYTTTDLISTYKVIFQTFKYGIRYHKYFNSLSFNRSEPFVFDVFYTMSTVSDLTPIKNYNYGLGIYPGLEINISKLGVFGFFAKVIPMMPVGELTYSKSLKNEPHKTPFFEVGIKREYSWFATRK